MRSKLFYFIFSYMIFVNTSYSESYSVLFDAPKGPGPYPAIIISHGSGGLTNVVYDWADYFTRELGYVTISINHHTPRGWPEGRNPPVRQGTNWRYDDLVSVLKKFKSNEKIDPKRIALAGWSAGAAMTMWGLEKGEDIGQASGLQHPFKAGILFYPYMFACNAFDFDKITFPIIHVHGSEDDTYRYCWQDQIKNMKSQKYELISKVYEGAVHLFDSSYARNTCRSITATVGGPYPDYELCYKYDEKAHNQSKADIKAFLAKHLNN